MAGERAFVDINVKRALLREYLKNEVKRAGFGGAEIQRTPMGTRVTLITERPGLVIGRKGDTIKALTDAIQYDFGFDKPQVEVVEIENPNLSAQIMSEKLASALERGWHFRRAGHSTVRRIMDNGARGCQVIISGKLTGQRHRTEKFKEGHIKFCGEPKLLFMEEGFTPAKLKLGIIGVKVQIMHPKARLPDEVNIREPEAAAQAQPASAEAEAPAEAAKAGEKEPVQKKKKAPREKADEAPVKQESPKPAEAPVKVEEKKPPKPAEAPATLAQAPAKVEEKEPPKLVEAPAKVEEKEPPKPVEAPAKVEEKKPPKPAEAPATLAQEPAKVEEKEPPKPVEAPAKVEEKEPPKPVEAPAKAEKKEPTSTEGANGAVKDQ